MSSCVCTSALLQSSRAHALVPPSATQASAPDQCAWLQVTRQATASHALNTCNAGNATLQTGPCQLNSHCRCHNAHNRTKAARPTCTQTTANDGQPHCADCVLHLTAPASGRPAWSGHCSLHPLTSNNKLRAEESQHATEHHPRYTGMVAHHPVHQGPTVSHSPQRRQPATQMNEAGHVQHARIHIGQQAGCGALCVRLPQAHPALHSPPEHTRCETCW